MLRRSDRGGEGESLYFPMVMPLLALLMRPVMIAPLRMPAPKRRAERVSSPLCRWM